MTAAERFFMQANLFVLFQTSSFLKGSMVLRNDPGISEERVTLTDIYLLLTASSVLSLCCTNCVCLLLDLFCLLVPFAI